MKRFILLCIVLLLLTSVVSAREGHIKLLAVTQQGTSFTGSPADLHLEIKPGSGRVFLDTFPLAKLDTQLSTRFAKEIACSHLDYDCSGIDFYYTIRSESAIIGGPSAGAATALLTVLVLEELPLNQSIAITGTINSGGLVGPVGGLQPKIDAAAASGITTVLIPQGKLLVDDPLTNQSSNMSVEPLDLGVYGESKGVEVIEVSTLDDLTFIYAQKEYQSNGKKIEIPEYYTETMDDVAQSLCERSDLLFSMVEEAKKNLTEIQGVLNLTDRSASALEKGHAYSAASFCFGANTRLGETIIDERNLSESTLRKRMGQLITELSQLEEEVDNRTLVTLSDLETYNVVKERIIDAHDRVGQAQKALTENETRRAGEHLSFASERYNSAVAWSSFFDMQSKEIEIDEETLKESCLTRLSEADERLQYAQLYLPERFEDSRRKMTRAYEDMREKRYALCLFKASSAKAEADVVLSLIGVSVESFPTYIEQKSDLIKQIIAEQSHKEQFPILAYSYYEYAGELTDHDPYAAALYLEYALELSNLELYFPTDDKVKPSLVEYQILPFLYFLSGVAIGLGIAAIFMPRKKRRRRKERIF